MKEHPILFNAPMVRALLDGSKTQTRRIVKPQPDISPEGNIRGWWLNRPLAGLLLPKKQDITIHSPFGQAGDQLWVREKFSGPHYQRKSAPAEWNECDPIWYWADNDPESGDWTKPKPSIHMPRWASRIQLEITDVRVELLNNISEADAISEGILSVRTDEWERKHFTQWRALFDAACEAGEKPPIGPSPSRAYQALWESINGAGSWDANPWVWVIEFRRAK